MAVGTDRWRGRACLLDKSSMERAPSGEIEDMLPPPGEIADSASGRGEKEN
jgi:hypothetical protein